MPICKGNAKVAVLTIIHSPSHVWFQLEGEPEPRKFIANSPWNWNGLIRSFFLANGRFRVRSALKRNFLLVTSSTADCLVEVSAFHNIASNQLPLASFQFTDAIWSSAIDKLKSHGCRSQMLNRASSKTVGVFRWWRSPGADLIGHTAHLVKDRILARLYV